MSPCVFIWSLNYRGEESRVRCSRILLVIWCWFCFSHVRMFVNFFLFPPLLVYYRFSFQSVRSLICKSLRALLSLCIRKNFVLAVKFDIVKLRKLHQSKNPCCLIILITIKKRRKSPLHISHHKNLIHSIRWSTLSTISYSILPITLILWYQKPKELNNNVHHSSFFNYSPFTTSWLLDDGILLVSFSMNELK